MNIKSLAAKGAKYIAKECPIILAAGAIAGVVVTAVVAVKNADKIKEVIQNRKDDLEDLDCREKEGEVTAEEAKEERKSINVSYFKPMIKAVAPIVVSTGLTILSIVGMNAVHLRRQAAIAAVAKIAEQSYKELYDTTKEEVGDKKFEEITKKIFKKESNLANEDQDPDKMDLKHGHYPILDPTQNHYIPGNRDTIKALEMWIKCELMEHFTLSLNEFYYHVNERQTTCGDFIGWTTDDGEVDITLTPGETPKGQPCYRMSFSPLPHVLPTRWRG